MKEFKFMPPNSGYSKELFELDDAISELNKHMHISDYARKKALDDYKSGKAYKFTFVYGFSVGVISAYNEVLSNAK